VTSDGGSPPVTARGVCWSTISPPTISDPHTSDGSGTGSYTSNITGLSQGTTYYVRAYATNSLGTGYGAIDQFICDNIPSVTTNDVSDISSTTATCGGVVTSEGGDSVSVRGVCWSTSPSPTTSNPKTTDGSGLGSFTSNITGLSEGIKYYVRAYATNSVGTSYGNQQSFTTSIGLPTVVTTPASSISCTSVSTGGEVTSDGGSPVTARGICFGTSSGPSITGSHTHNGAGIGTFTTSLIDLNSGILYYIRAYATNSVGTNYGSEETFTTLTTPTVTTDPVTSITDTTATTGGDVTSDGGSSVTVKGICLATHTNPIPFRGSKVTRDT
jgi:hypothetical protein